MRFSAVLGLVGAAALGAGLLGAGLMGVGHAADLGLFPLPEAPALSDPDAPLEFGAGWYLRGDASFEPADHPVFKDADFNFTKRDWDWAAGGGIGYKFNSFLRVDLTGDYLAPVSGRVTVSDGVNAVSTRTDLQRYDGMASLYLDLGNWYGIMPYIGGGVGFSVFDPSARVSVTTVASGATSTRRYAPGSDTQFAWSASAGVAFQLDPHVLVDVGYRHLDLGRFSTTLAGYTVDRSFTEDQVRVGLRYMID